MRPLPPEAIEPVVVDRLRYRVYATPWFDYLLVSKDEMQAILAGTGWAVKRFLDSKGSAYVAVMEREPA